jgi:hypothetical protein
VNDRNYDFSISESINLPLGSPTDKAYKNFKPSPAMANNVGPKFFGQPVKESVTVTPIESTNARRKINKKLKSITKRVGEHLPELAGSRSPKLKKTRKKPGNSQASRLKKYKSTNNFKTTY